MIRKLVSLATAMMIVLSILSCNMLAVCAAATGISYVDIDKSDGLNVGDTLEALPVFTGTADGTEVVTYQWVKTAIETKSHSNASANDSRYLAISGATGKTYTIGESDIGYIIKVKATYNGTTVWSGDCVAVGNILSSYSASPATHVLTKYGNSSTATQLVLGTAGTAESAAWAAKVNNSNNADFYTHIATGNNVTEGGYSYHASGDNKLWVSEYTLQAPVFLNNILVETGAGNVYYAIPCVAVNVVYEGETQYKPWANHTASFKTKAQMANDSYNRIHLINVTGDATLIGSDAGKKIAKIQVVVYTLKDTANNRTDSVVVREISGFSKILPAITAINGLESASVNGTEIQSIPFDTTVEALLGAISVNSVTNSVAVVNEAKDTAISASTVLDETMFLELTSADGDKVYYSFDLTEPPGPEISAVSIAGVQIDTEENKLSAIPWDTTVAALEAAITIQDAISFRVVNADFVTVPEADSYLDSTMLVELTDVVNNQVYYSLVVNAVPVPAVTQINLAGASIDAVAKILKDIPDGIDAGGLMAALVVENAASSRLVAYDKVTAVDNDILVDDSMFLELTPVIGTEKLYYSITLKEVIENTDPVNLALAGTIVSNGAYTSSPVGNAIDNKNSTAFTSAGNTDPSNPIKAYRPYGEAPVVTLTLDGEALISKVCVYESSQTNYFTIYTSINGRDWNEIGNTAYVEAVTLTDTGSLGGTVYLHELSFEPDRARFVKGVYSTAANVSVRHFQVWGNYAPAAVVTDNLAYNKVGIGSYASAATRISNLFDLNKTTRWHALYNGTENPWVSVDLGSAKNIGNVTVYDDTQDAVYAVFGSLEGVTWEPIGNTVVTESASAPYKKEFSGNFEARYVKIVSDLAQNINLYEFEVYAGEVPPVDTDDLAYLKSTVSSIAALDVSHDASKATDGENNTAFLTDIGSSYKLSVDLGEIKSVDKIKLCELAGYNHINQFSLRVSADQVNWHTVYTGTAIGSEKTVQFSAKSARYIELLVSGVSSTPSGIATLSVYASGSNNNALQAAINSISIPEIITESDSLPVSAVGGATITWQSSNENVIKVQNGITIIQKPARDTSVVLTATYTIGSSSEQVTYQRVVRGYNLPVQEFESVGGGGGAYVAAPPVVTPNDDKAALLAELEGHWGEKEISVLVEKEIVKGSDGVLQLKQTVTRAEFGAMIVRGMGWKSNSYRGGYSDIASTDWFAGELQILIDRGIMQGADGAFRPNDAMTREEMATVIFRMMKNAFNIPSANHTQNRFSDESSISSWAYESVMESARNGILTGFETGEFKPAELLNREQAMVVIFRLMSKGGAL